jgi:16S rRNA (guanine527-N7)-methyltransferase
MLNIPDSLISNALLPYGVLADDTLCEKIRVYVSILLQWNRAISLTTVTEPLEIIKFHFGESLFAVQNVPIREGRLADVGSGAGFPGIPLRMVNPGLDLTLIESNAKKCAFLSEIARRIELDHVNVLHCRMEDVPVNAGQFDFVTARAIGHHGDLLAWAKERLGGAGKLVLWLGETDANEISRDPGWLWSAPILIPGSKRRFIVAGSQKP